jgi:hypothetical protein
MHTYTEKTDLFAVTPHMNSIAQQQLIIQQEIWNRSESAVHKVNARAQCAKVNARARACTCLKIEARCHELVY